ncbi:MAG: hypothetical protein RL170_1317, partial [Bacteroidota bacterium]
MKKTITTLTACFLMAFSFSALAQNDSSRNSTKIVLDSDTITIGNMIIVKKQGYQNDSKNINKHNGTIAIGNVVILKKQNNENYNYNRRRNRPYGTT